MKHTDGIEEILLESRSKEYIVVKPPPIRVLFEAVEVLRAPQSQTAHTLRDIQNIFCSRRGILKNKNNTTNNWIWNYFQIDMG